MFRFSFATLLAGVFFVVIGTAAVLNATDLWRQITVTSAVVCLLLATLAAVFSERQARLFAGGFAVTGWLYLTLAFVAVLGLRDDLLTDTSIQWLAETIHGDAAAAVAGQALAGVDNDGTLDLFVSLGSLSFPQKPSLYPNLTPIGHALWTMIVSWLGGVVALWLGRRERRETQMSQ